MEEEWKEEEEEGEGEEWKQKTTGTLQNLSPHLKQHQLELGRAKLECCVIRCNT